MVVTCVIEFDNNPAGVFFAGQILTGTVTLTSDRVKQVRGVSLKIRGFAHTSWSEDESNSTTDAHGKTTTTTRSTTYYGHVDYIASLTYLMGSESGGTMAIEPGVHRYTFACHIPHTCPSSFEGLYGHVRYTIKVALIRPFKFDQTYTKGFTVLKVMDLNYDSPLLRVPASVEVQKNYCCGPCKSAPLQIKVTLAQSGYVPGQNIPVDLLVSNDSNIPVHEMKLSLVMLVCYYSQTPSTKTRSERFIVSKFKGDPVLNRCRKQFTYLLPVPATPPTCFNLCSIIQIAYQVEVEAKVKGCHANQMVFVPVTIGNVPLISGVIQQQPTSNMQRDVMGAAAVGATRFIGEENIASIDVKEMSSVDFGTNASNGELPMPPSPWATDTNIPPPNYEEAMYMQRAKINADEEHDYGEADFMPRYPVFSVPSPTAPPNDEMMTNSSNTNTTNIDPNKSTWL